MPLKSACALSSYRNPGWGSSSMSYSSLLGQCAFIHNRSSRGLIFARPAECKRNWQCGIRAFHNVGQIRPAKAVRVASPPWDATGCRRGLLSVSISPIIALIPIHGCLLLDPVRRSFGLPWPSCANFASWRNECKNKMFSCKNIFSVSRLLRCEA